MLSPGVNRAPRWSLKIVTGCPTPDSGLLQDSQDGGYSTQASSQDILLGNDEDFNLTLDLEPLIAANLPIGDIMSLDKPKHTARFLFNNKNGFHLYDRHGGDLMEDCASIARLGIDYAGFEEPNLDTTKSRVKLKIAAAARTVFDHYKLEFGSSPHQHQNEYKPGGTLTIVAGRLVGRVVDSSHDYLGRWTRTILTGKGGKRIAVYNCYQVGNKSPSSCGELTVINQLYSIYVHEGRSNTNPRYNHYADMTEAITSDVTNGYSIILGGDFNQTIMDGSVGMSRLVQDCKLVDPIYYHHGIDNFNTCSRGRTVIDYIFVSEDILDSVNSCGYHPFNDIILSDHRAVFIDFDDQRLFGSKTIALPKPSEKERYIPRRSIK